MDEDQIVREVMAHGRTILLQAMINLLMARQEAELRAWAQWLEYQAFVRWRRDQDPKHS